MLAARNRTRYRSWSWSSDKRRCKETGWQVVGRKQTRWKGVVAMHPG